MCSAEYWVFDLDGQVGKDREWGSKIAEAKAAGVSLAMPRPGSKQDPSLWSLLAASPHSPSSRSYPDRGASAAPHFAAFKKPDESVAAGWPVHRYKHSMVSARVALPAVGATVTEGRYTQTMLMFGGESYNPAAYFQDVWTFDYSHAIEANSSSSTIAATASSPSSADSSSSHPSSQSVPSSPPAASRLTLAMLQRHRDLERLLHETPLSHYERDLPKSRLVEPAAFNRHDPPGGWGPAPAVRSAAARNLPHMWRSSPLGLQPSGGFGQAPDAAFWAAFIAALAFVLLVAVALWMCSHWVRIKDEKTF